MTLKSIRVLVVDDERILPNFRPTSRRRFAKSFLLGPTVIAGVIFSKPLLNKTLQVDYTERSADDK